MVRTSGVRAVGEKTARAPVWRRTDCEKSQLEVTQAAIQEAERGLEGLVPIVPRPPILKRPKRLKGAEQVVMFGVTLRMTITSDGLGGISLEVIVKGSPGMPKVLRDHSIKERLIG